MINSAVVFVPSLTFWFSFLNVLLPFHPPFHLPFPTLIWNQNMMPLRAWHSESCTWKTRDWCLIPTFLMQIPRNTFYAYSHHQYCLSAHTLTVIVNKAGLTHASSNVLVACYFLFYSSWQILWNISSPEYDEVQHTGIIVGVHNKQHLHKKHLTAEGIYIKRMETFEQNFWFLNVEGMLGS